MASGMFVPQLVTPVDTSFLAKIGNTIGTLKQDSEIADILKGIDPYDPNSKQRVIGDLRAHSREGREMADRMEGLDIRRQTATQQGEYQQGQLGVARDRLGLEREEFDLKKGDRDYVEKGLNAPWQGRSLGDIPPVAPGGAPGAPSAAPARRRVPQGEVDYWNDPKEDEGGPPEPPPAARPSTRGGATPLFRAPGASVAPPVVGGFATRPAPGVRAAGGLLATGAADADPLPPPPPAPVGGTSGTGAAPPPIAPQGLLPGPFGPMASAVSSAAIGRALPGAPAPPALGGGAAPVAAAPAPQTQVAAAEPVETEPAEVEPAEEPVTAEAPRARARVDYTPRQIELSNRINYLDKFIGRGTPGQDKRIAAQKAELTAEFNEIEAFRTRGDKVREKVEAAESLDEIKRRSKIVETMGKEMRNNLGLKNDLTAMKQTINSPNYPGGIMAEPYVWLGRTAIYADRLMKWAGQPGLADTMGEDWYNRWVQDPVARARTIEKLSNSVTLKTLGGSLGQYISNTDRGFAQKMNATLGDDIESANRVIDMRLAEIAHHDKMHQIVTQGVAQKKTATQIEARLRRFGEENRLYEHKPLPGQEKGEPTELGRRIDPEGARKWDAEQKKKRAEDIETREKYRDPGAGEAAVVGGRPTPAQVRATREFDAAVRDVPGRPVTGAGSSRASSDPAAGLERAQSDVEGIRSMIPTQEGARELLRGDNPATRFFQGPGRMGYGSEGVSGPAPQRAGEGLDIEQDFGLPSIGGIVNQGTRLAPGGIPWEAYRRSTNIERRSEPNEVPMPLAQQQMAAFDWMRDAEGQPVGPLSRAAGLADLEARAYARPGGAVQIPAALPLPPLPRRRPRREEKR